MFNDKKLSIIGSGVMAEAVIQGMLREELLAPSNIMAAGPRQERGDTLAKRYGVQTTQDNQEAATTADILMIAVKPQVLGHVLPEIHGKLDSSALLISIVAGAPIRAIAEGLEHSGVVRAMPNTPAQIGKGITVWTATDDVTDEQRQQTKTILGALGDEEFVEDEDFLNAATALSGTGPAYVFLFMEALIDAGVHLGFSRRLAEKLVLQTMYGSVEYARHSPRHPATLRNQVTSPGGTSAEALYHLEKGGLRTVLSRAVWAAYQRSVALGRSADQRLAGRSPETGDEV